MFDYGYIKGLIMKLIKFLPGIFLSFAIAGLAMWLESQLPIHLIGSAVIAMFIGMIFTLLTCFGGGYFIGKALGLNWKLSNLISAGTGICGGSAMRPLHPQ